MVVVQRFATLTEYDRHAATEHIRPIDQHACQQCERSYKRASSLRKHVRRRHGAEAKLKFVCGVCGKDFLFKNEFVTHEYQHSQVRKHACDICGRRYTSSSTLVQHMRTHKGRRTRSGLVWVWLHSLGGCWWWWWGVLVCMCV